MKRELFVLIIAVMCLSLCSCGKSEAATNVDNMILEIGEITLQSGDKITDAEEAVGNLKESEYKQLEQISILEEARTTYDRLVEEKRIADNNKAISEIKSAIDAIGAVTLEQESAIISARTLYNKGNNDVKAGITNYEVLEQAEAELSNLKAQTVINLIDQIGQVSLDSGEKIDAAKAAYKTLTSTEKGQVTNSANLAQAEAELSNLKVQTVINLIDQIGQVSLDSGEKIDAAKAAYKTLTSTEKGQVTNSANIEAASAKLSELQTENRVKSIIKVTELQVSRPNSAGGVDVFFGFRNMSDRIIKYITFEVVPYNAVGDIVYCEIRDHANFRGRDTGPYEKGEGLAGDYSWYWENAWYNSTITDVELKRLDIEYMDGTRESISGDELNYVF